MMVYGMIIISEDEDKVWKHIDHLEEFGKVYWGTDRYFKLILIIKSSFIYITSGIF